MRDQEKGEFRAEDDTGCCHETEEYLGSTHVEVRLYARPLEKTPEGNGHCLGLVWRNESKKGGVDDVVPSPKAKKLGSVRDA